MQLLFYIPLCFYYFWSLYAMLCYCECVCLHCITDAGELVCCVKIWIVCLVITTMWTMSLQWNVHSTLMNIVLLWHLLVFVHCVVPTLQQLCVNTRFHSLLNICVRSSMLICHVNACSWHHSQEVNRSRWNCKHLIIFIMNNNRTKILQHTKLNTIKSTFSTKNIILATNMTVLYTVLTTALTIRVNHHDTT